MLYVSYHLAVVRVTRCVIRAEVKFQLDALNDTTTWPIPCGMEQIGITERAFKMSE